MCSMWMISSKEALAISRVRIFLTGFGATPSGLRLRWSFGIWHGVEFHKEHI